MQQVKYEDGKAFLPVVGFRSIVEIDEERQGLMVSHIPYTEDAEPLVSAVHVDEVLTKQRELRLEIEARNVNLQDQLAQALSQVRRLDAQVQILTCERNGWQETANMFARGQEFYQAIVREIGEQFGPEAYICDDGSVSDDVLALKVPELVEELFTDYFTECEKVSAPRRFLRNVRNLFTSH